MGRRASSTGGRRRVRALATLALGIATCLLAAPQALAQGGAAGGFEGSWADRALKIQYELGSDLGVVDAPWIGTHNSFNSIAEMGPTLSTLDSNQAIDLRSQLEADIRSLELDLHRVGGAPKVCHALEGGTGCTIEKNLPQVLPEIEGWLREPANRDQVLLLYLEDDLGDVATHERAAAALESSIGDLIYRPPAGDCDEIDPGLTRNDVRAAGKQVVIVTRCGDGLGAGWSGLAHAWDFKRESRPIGYEDFPGCGPDFSREDYSTALIRYFEDSTQLTAGVGTPDEGITPATAAAMQRCGVDLVGFDQLRPFDGRLASSVWSWARKRPLAEGGGRCALIRVGRKQQFGRWIDRRCGALRRPAACLDDAGRWRIPGGRKGKVRGGAAARKCRKAGYRTAVPRTGYENQLLRKEMSRRKVKTTWLGLRRRGGEWRALDPR